MDDIDSSSGQNERYWQWENIYGHLTESLPIKHSLCFAFSLTEFVLPLCSTWTRIWRRDTLLPFQLLFCVSQKVFVLPLHSMCTLCCHVCVCMHSVLCIRIHACMHLFTSLACISIALFKCVQCFVYVVWFGAVAFICPTEHSIIQ